MPRAFLITHRRYNATNDGDTGESSPEHKVSLPEDLSPQPHSLNDDSSNSSCPDELYNLTKLAEVSLAAAAGQLYHHRHLSAVPTHNHSAHTTYTHKLFDRGARAQQRQHVVQTSLSSPTSTTEESHECPDCGKRYSTSSNLARHRQTHRSLADKKARRCPHCEKVYVSMPAYSMHVRTHTQGCKCHFCGKCFSRPWLLQGHIRTHTGEKPFKCQVCQKAFADKSNLRAHVQTHSSTKPHVCARCGKAFALKSYLYKHEESSCMRSVRNLQLDQQTTQPTSAPTPVIVRPERQPPFRSTVISPNPERALYASVELPRYCVSEDQPVDFSNRSEYREENTGYAIGLAIAV